MILTINMGTLFPGDSKKRKRLSQFLAFSNDVIANAKAMATAQFNGSTGNTRRISEDECMYFRRIVCGHTHEALDSFSNCYREGVFQSYLPLIQDGNTWYEKVKTVAVKEFSQDADRSLREFIRQMRLATFHYIPDENSMEVDWIVGGDSTPMNSRFIFVEEAIRAQIRRELNLDEAELDSLDRRAATFWGDLFNFVDRFVATIYESRPDAFVQRLEPSQC